VLSARGVFIKGSEEMICKKLIGASILICFALTPVSAGQAGETIRTQAVLLPTAACYYGYAKNKKTGKCIELKCAKSEMLDKNGHKCIPKPRKKRSTYRGSH